MQSLTTARLRLSPPRARDWQSLPVLADPLVSDHEAQAEATRVFAEWAGLTREQAPGAGGGWTVRRRLRRRPLGLILYLPDPEQPRVAVLSIAFNADARGKGLAAEALEAALRALAGSGAFDRFAAEIAPRNTACLRLFARAGFARERDALLRTSHGETAGVRLTRAAQALSAVRRVSGAGPAPPLRPAPAGSGSGRPQRTAWAHP